MSITTTSPRFSRALAVGLFAITLALVPAVAACSKSASNAAPTDSTSSTLPDARSRSLADVTVTGDFGTEPTVTFDTAYVGDTEESAVLIEGTGPVIAGGQRITADYVAVSGNDGALLDSTYGAEKMHLVLTDATLLSAVYDAIVGQRVGSRILIAADTVETNGTWILFVFDIVDAVDVPASASGTPVTPPAWLPVVTVVDGVPQIAKPEGDAPTELVAQVLIEGDGPVITAGQTVTLQYTGIIWATGALFDTSWETGAVDFPIGTGATIAGFDSSLVGQTIGSRVLIVIPPDQGYGSGGNAQAGISGTDTLVFVVDLLIAS